MAPKIPETKIKEVLSESSLKKEVEAKLHGTPTSSNAKYLPYKDIIDSLLQEHGQTISTYAKTLGLADDAAYESFFSTYNADIMQQDAELSDGVSTVLSEVGGIDHPKPSEPNHPSFETNSVPDGMYAEAQAQQEEMQEEMQAQQEELAAEQIQREQDEQIHEEELRLDAEQEKKLSKLKKLYEEKKAKILAGPDATTKLILWGVYLAMTIVDGILGLVPFIGDSTAAIISMIGWAIVSIFFGFKVFTSAVKFYAIDLIFGMLLDVIPGFGTVASMIFDYAYEPVAVLIKKNPVSNYLKHYLDDIHEGESV